MSQVVAVGAGTLVPKAESGALSPRSSPTGRSAILGPVKNQAAQSALQEPESATALAALLEQVAAGNRASFNALYDATVSRVYSMAMRVVSRHELAEEVVGDVYIQIWERSVSFDSARGTPVSWLLMLSRSRSIDILRREKARSPDTTAIPADQLSASSDADEGPENWLEWLDRRSSIYRALETLQPEQRQLIALSFFRGHSHAEIAGITGQPLGTVKTQIRRGLTALRLAIDEPETTAEA